MRTYAKILIAVAAFLALAAGTWNAARLQYQTGFGDMRGRVVGARLVRDGKLPYYYTWRPGDPLKYFFNQMVDTSTGPRPRQVSALTASPAFLLAIGPVAFQPEYRIDWGAFLLFHAFFLISILLAIRYCRPGHWPYVLLAMVPIILTDGWLGNFVTVQYYMLFGFLFLMIALLLWRGQQVAAGILFAILILLRPNALVFAFPFVIFGLRYLRFFSVTAAAIALYALYILASPFQKSVWQEYFSALKEHQAIHMSETFKEPEHRVPGLQFLPNPFEGVNYYKLDSLQKAHPIYVHPEASGFKSAYNSVTGHKPPVALLLGLLCVSAGVAWLWLWLRYRKRGGETDAVYRAMLAGLLFYFLSSFFSSITAASYQFPQWWAVAALFGIFYDRIPKGAYVLFLAGIVFNLYLVPGFRGKHFLSEVLLISATFWAVIAPSGKASSATA